MSGDRAQKRLSSRHPAHCLHDDDFARLERLAARRPGWHAVQVTLAWHLRQRDGRRVRAIADAIAPALAGRTDRAGRRMAARLELARAEVASLALDIDAGRPAAGQRTGAVRKPGRPDRRRRLPAAGGAELPHLGSRRPRQGLPRTPTTRLLAQGDEVREGIALAEIATALPGLSDASGRRACSSSSPGSPRGPRSHCGGPRSTPRCRAARCSSTRAASADIVSHASVNMQRAKALGLPRLHVHLSLNCAIAHESLNDLLAAITLREAALVTSREHGWPAYVAHSLASLARNHEMLGNQRARLELLERACADLGPIASSFNSVVAQIHLGEARLAAGNVDGALEVFRLAHERASARRFEVLLPRTMAGEGRCLAARGDFEAAHRLTLSAFEQAPGHDTQMPHAGGADRAASAGDPAGPARPPGSDARAALHRVAGRTDRDVGGQPAERAPSGAVVARLGAGRRPGARPRLRAPGQDRGRERELAQCDAGDGGGAGAPRGRDRAARAPVAAGARRGRDGAGSHPRAGDRHAGPARPDRPGDRRQPGPRPRVRGAGHPCRARSSRRTC